MKLRKTPKNFSFYFNRFLELLKIEMLLFLRDFFGFFFTFLFPVLMLILFGSIYGNEPSSYFNGLGAMDVSVPAYSAMIIGVTGLMAFPLTLTGYKERNIYKRFDATPVGKGYVMLIQTLVNFLMTLAGFCLLFTAGRLLYKIQVAGSFLSISAALLLSILSIFSIGFLLTAVAKTAKIANLLCYLLYFIMLFLSGATMPKELFPENIRSLSLLLPLTHVVTILQGVFRKAPLYEYQNSIVILILVTLFCTLTGALLYRRKNWA